MIAIGETVAGYRLDADVGRGGMGVVYRAHDPRLERPVALKLIAPEAARDERFRARFVRESLLAARLDHPNVIPVYGAGEEDGHLYIAMRFVAGADLAALLRNAGPLDAQLAVDLVAQAAAALDAAHANGLVHRDIKPANLLVDGGHVYLTDFGLARADDDSSSLTGSGEWLGTPDYASPEQIEGGPLDARSDVYSLGCLLYAALAGAPPFASFPAARKATAQLDAQPPPLPAEHARLEPVIRRALAKRREERWRSAGAFADAARAAIGPRRTARGRPPASRTARLVRRRRPRTPVVVAVAIAAAALGVLLLTAAGHRPLIRTPRAAPPRSVMPPAADASAGTLRCSPTSCAQAGHAVAAPVADGSCAGGGHWTRIDAGERPLIACVPPRATSSTRASAIVPDVAGGRLDRVEQYLDRIGIQHDTSGGGLLGIIDAGNWTVCAARPPAGSPGTRVKLFVDRSC